MRSWEQRQRRTPFVTQDASLGTYLYAPPELWEQLFFTNLQGALASGTPSVADVVAGGYDAPEPFAAVSELIGYGQSRRSVSPNLFASSLGTRLFVLGFAEDRFFLPSEEQRLYTFLTGEPAPRGFIEVDGPNAVHDAYLSEPGMVVEALRAVASNLQQAGDGP
jgi:hypothetical protein